MVIDIIPLYDFDSKNSPFNSNHVPAFYIHGIDKKKLYYQTFMSQDRE